MERQFRYLARRFLQHPKNEIPLFSFVASADDIVKWAGVPRKAYEFKNGVLIGFQRQLEDQRIKEINEFLSSDSNVCPTAVVTAFRKDTLTFQPVDAGANLSGGNDPGDLVWIAIKVEDTSALSLGEAIKQYLKLVKPRLPNGDDILTATEEPIEGSVETGEPVEETEEFILHDSHLVRFTRSLEAVLRSVEERGDDADLYTEEEQKLLETLVELLKPAMLVDGQHRVYGANSLEENIAFAVCAMIDASWEEQVFQFVVVNQRAQPIAAEFLSAIVSTSLTQSEIESLTERLDQAGIAVEEHQMMDLVNNAPESPFRGIIRFRIPGETGKLPYPGMRQLANQFRKLTPSPRFTLLASHLCSGNTAERRRAWQQTKWFPYFCAFWDVIKERYEPTPPGDEPLWSPDSQLLKIAVLQIIQDEFLEWTVDSKRKWPDDMGQFKELVKTWIEYVPRGFFAEKWGIKSIPSPEGRQRIRDALKERVRNPNFQFRKSRLFQGT